MRGQALNNQAISYVILTKIGFNKADLLNHARNGSVNKLFTKE